MKGGNTKEGRESGYPGITQPCPTKSTRQRARSMSVLYICGSPRVLYLSFVVVLRLWRKVDDGVYVCNAVRWERC